MEIGQVEMRSGDITVTMRAVTDELGERVAQRMISGWTSIPIQQIIDLSTQFIESGPFMTINDLRKARLDSKI